MKFGNSCHRVGEHDNGCYLNYKVVFWKVVSEVWEYVVTSGGAPKPIATLIDVHYVVYAIDQISLSYLTSSLERYLHQCKVPKRTSKIPKPRLTSIAASNTF